MTTIVEASVPTDQFALQETVRRVPDVAFETVRVVTDAADGVMPLIWGTGAAEPEITAALEADDSTETVSVHTRLHEASLYQVAWTTRVRVVTNLLAADHGAILGARASEGTWTFRIFFERREGIAAIVEECDRYGVDLRIERIYPLTEPSRAGRSDLTEEQLRTVETALERGYYEVPRRTTLTELSAELGVSHQALSERLRRGHRRLVESALGSQMRLESQP